MSSLRHCLHHHVHFNLSTSSLTATRTPIIFARTPTRKYANPARTPTNPITKSQYILAEILADILEILAGSLWNSCGDYSFKFIQAHSFVFQFLSHYFKLPAPIPQDALLENTRIPQEPLTVLAENEGILADKKMKILAGEGQLLLGSPARNYSFKFLL